MIRLHRRRRHLLSFRAKLALAVGIAIGIVAGGTVQRDLKPENRSVQR